MLGARTLRTAGHVARVPAAGEPPEPVGLSQALADTMTAEMSAKYKKLGELTLSRFEAKAREVEAVDTKIKKAREALTLQRFKNGVRASRAVKSASAKYTSEFFDDIRQV